MTERICEAFAIAVNTDMFDSNIAMEQDEIDTGLCRLTAKKIRNIL